MTLLRINFEVRSKQARNKIKNEIFVVAIDCHIFNTLML